MKIICLLICSLLWLCPSSLSKKMRSPKQHNLFNMKGVELPNIISNTTLSGGKESNQISLLSAAVTSYDESDNWFMDNVQNIPQFVKDSYFHLRENAEGVCHLRLLGLGHYGNFYKKNKRHVYEGGLSTVRIDNGLRVILRCHYITGRNQHFVLVVRHSRN